MRKSFLFSLVFLGFSMGLLVLWVKFEYDRFYHTPLKVGQEGLHLVVPSGATVRSVATELHQREALEYPLYLVLLARWQGVARDIKAGEYDVQPATTPPQFLRQIVAGKVKQYSLTLVEGWTFSQVMKAVQNSPHLRQTLGEIPVSEIMKRLGYPQEHPEGRFFPDTYFFPRGTTDVDFLQRAYQLMAEHLAREWGDRTPGLPYQNSYEALILASIVERETALPEELSLVAGVFTRRLQKGMRLQTDPTVIYGLGERFDGDLRRRDLREDTPYNTYTRSGLPPTPICMPSLGALKAALRPAGGEALYFVARGDGSHYFSATFEEHRAAVQTYQLDRN
ncbi:aminodeoxychorismate lyase [Nitrosococcus halophilus Nc 4]|uniref:Endolytic murein transglycosylase n=1 Tax=Nitrosococcus halophilus (strain Nc4) TaxID=472759 RepID=D5BZF9_NITHN|nr:endolytic transglycosylase MltG [Nitrosococcus halophilus]ADE16173.1 aminodeoxychorismate lyase [Nitrosococcus halophilus Nc 4]